MSEPRTFPVYDETGCIGVVLAPARFLDARPEKTIRLNNGQEISVPSSALKVQQDGSFRLLTGVGQNDSQLRPAPPPRPPIAAPAATQSVPAPAPPAHPPTTVAQSSTPQGAMPAGYPVQSLPVGAFFQEDYEIERVPVGRIVDGPVTQRQEGDTLVLPVMEEVLVYQKKLYLREEIRITRRKKTVEEVRRIEDKPGQNTR